MWNDLKAAHAAIKDRAIIDLFDDARADDFSVETQHMRLDYAKTKRSCDPQRTAPTGPPVYGGFHGNAQAFCTSRLPSG